MCGKEVELLQVERQIGFGNLHTAIVQKDQEIAINGVICELI